MDRRSFLKNLFGVASVVGAAAVLGSTGADALPAVAPASPNAPAAPAVATDKDIAGTQAEKTHWRPYFHRHRRRVFVRRRRWRRW